MGEQKRGQLTERIKARSRELLGYEIETTEFRLMPYIMYTMMNEQRLNPSKINGEERAIVAKWKQAGHVSGGREGLAITRQFWNVLSEIVWLGYVDLFDATEVLI